jgi:hypothetical protein
MLGFTPFGKEMVERFVPKLASARELAARRLVCSIGVKNAVAVRGTWGGISRTPPDSGGSNWSKGSRNGSSYLDVPCSNLCSAKMPVHAKFTKLRDMGR